MGFETMTSGRTEKLTRVLALPLGYRHWHYKHNIDVHAVRFNATCTRAGKWTVHWRAPWHIHMFTSYGPVIMVHTCGILDDVSVYLLYSNISGPNTAQAANNNSRSPYQMLFSSNPTSTHLNQSPHQSQVDHKFLTTSSQNPSYLLSKCLSSPLYQSGNLKACKLDLSPDIWCMSNHSLTTQILAFLIEIEALRNNSQPLSPTHESIFSGSKVDIPTSNPTLLK